MTITMIPSDDDAQDKVMMMKQQDDNDDKEMMIEDKMIVTIEDVQVDAAASVIRITTPLSQHKLVSKLRNPAARKSHLDGYMSM